jgi:hypothetical protein
MNKLLLMTLSPLRFHLSISVILALFGTFLHNSVAIKFARAAHGFQPLRGYELGH